MLGYGDRHRVIPEVRRAAKADNDIMAVLRKIMQLKTIEDAGFSNADYHQAELDLYISAGFFVKFEQGFHVPNALMSHQSLVTSGVLSQLKENW